MVLVHAAPEPTIYFKEAAASVRETRFSLKQVQMVQPRSEKKLEAVNVQVCNLPSLTKKRLN